MKRLIVSSFVLIIAVSTVFAMGKHHQVSKFVADPNKPFAALFHDAMRIMHINIDGAQEDGDPDHDYTSLMIPHCQGAVDMSLAILLHSKSTSVIELAKRIAARREAEIAEFGAWMSTYSKNRAPLTEFDAHINELMNGMHENIENKPAVSDPDQYYVLIMIPHHEAAIEISRGLLEYGNDPTIRKIAKRIIEEETEEIAEMKKIMNK